ncbi:hypothetical protein JL721_1548 [Aureococcus anophagefferens]|nr:hypothetical protein JL721_1548 [Aureococcus anophagefferens]
MDTDAKDKAESAKSAFVFAEGPGAFLEKLATLSRPARVRRLLLVAKHSADAPQALAFAAAAVDEAKRGLDTAGYRDAVAAHDGLGPASKLGVDAPWLEASDARARETQERLEGELASKRSSLNKDAIWAAYRGLGDFFVERGENAHALKCFVRMRDYSTSSQRTVETCGRVAAAAVDLKNWAHVANYCAKADHALDALGPSARADGGARDLALRLQACGAAAGGDRDGAPEGGAAAPGRDAVPPGDFAACAALLALASLPRDELKRSCVEDVAFKNAVASLPRVKALLSDALSGSYAAALRELAAIVDELSFDPALRPHAAHLGALAGDKCLADYCKPYGAVCLRRMAGAFDLSLEDVESAVAKLVVAKKIHARVDSQRKTLIAVDRDARAASLGTVLDHGRAYVGEVKALALRMSCLEHDLVVRARGGALGAPGLATRKFANRRYDAFDHPAQAIYGRDDDDDDEALEAVRRQQMTATDARAFAAALDDDDDDDEILHDAPAL